MTKLTKKQVLHLSVLANIPLETDELDDHAQNISKFLEHVTRLNDLDLSKTPTTNQVTNKTNEFREDVLKPSLTQKQALANANQSKNGYFVVDAVINND